MNTRNFEQNYATYEDIRLNEYLYSLEEASHDVNINDELQAMQETTCELLEKLEDARECHTRYSALLRIKQDLDGLLEQYSRNIM